jgi:hypothetical protein
VRTVITEYHNVFKVLSKRMKVDTCVLVVSTLHLLVCVLCIMLLSSDKML